MTYKEYIELVTNLPKIWPTVRISAYCIDWENDVWIGNVMSSGEDGFGNEIAMREIEIHTAERLKEVITYFNKFSRDHILIKNSSMREMG
jgi:hypothetical protein